MTNQVQHSIVDMRPQQKMAELCQLTGVKLITSLSLSLYIYIYMCVCVCVCVRTRVFTSAAMKLNILFTCHHTGMER